MQELPTPTGMSTFSAELITDSASSDANSPGRGNRSRGRDAATTAGAGEDHDGNKNPSRQWKACHRIPLPLAD